MHHRTSGRREGARMSRAVKSVLTGPPGERFSVRRAARVYRVARSTLQDRISSSRRRQTRIRRVAGRRRQFSEAEEDVIISTLVAFADKGVPLNRRHLQEAFKTFIGQLAPSRRAAMPFRNGVPGWRFLTDFEKRHRDRIFFGRGTRQEAKRWSAVNGETLSTHFATLEKIISDNNIDSSRVWNLDETGGTPGKDVVGAIKERRYLRRERHQRDIIIPEFVSSSRATVMAVVSAAGDTAPPLFVFKGARLPYRVVEEAGKEVVQTYSTFLPRGSAVAMRDQNGGVDSENFYQWARLFVESVKDLTSNGRKLLLTYDAYRAHLSLRVLELFLANGIIVYALPAHTSGKLQPLDVVVFSAFKAALNSAVTTVLGRDPGSLLNMWDYCALLRAAYGESFTKLNIQRSFLRSGMWPLDPTRLLSVPRPKDNNDLSTILTPAQLVALLEEKREEARRGILGMDVKILTNGFVDTTRGAVLTSERAMAAAREKNKQDEEKRALEDERAARKEKRAAQKLIKDAEMAVAAAEKAAKYKRDIEAHKRARLYFRAKHLGLNIQEFKKTQRPMAVKRAVARERTAQRKKSTQQRCAVLN